MFIAKTKDGKQFQGSNWMEIPTDVEIFEVQLGVEGIQAQILRGMDSYYYLNEAVAFQGEPKGRVVAEIIGGVLSEADIAIEIRMEKMGQSYTRLLSMNRFPYDRAILRKGGK